MPARCSTSSPHATSGDAAFTSIPEVSDPPVDQLPKEKPGLWTRRMAFAHVRHGSNIQLLPYSLVSALGPLCTPACRPAELKWAAKALVRRPTQL
jgi:hypothetical protein